jgi:hypothetical protein
MPFPGPDCAGMAERFKAQNLSYGSLHFRKKRSRKNVKVRKFAKGPSERKSVKKTCVRQHSGVRKNPATEAVAQ